MLASRPRLLVPWVAVLALGLSLLACGDPIEPLAAPAPTSAVPADAAAAPPPTNPLQALAPAPAGDDTFAGVVQEAIPAGGYTYLRVATQAGDRWVATMGKGAPVGHRVQVKNMGTRHDFHSRRLGRRFEELAFGIVREA